MKRMIVERRQMNIKNNKMDSIKKLRATQKYI